MSKTGRPQVLEIFPFNGLVLTEEMFEPFIGNNCIVCYRRHWLPEMVEGIVLAIDILKKGWTIIVTGDTNNDIDCVWAHKIEFMTILSIEELLVHPQENVRKLGQEKLRKTYEAPSIQHRRSKRF